MHTERAFLRRIKPVHVHTNGRRRLANKRLKRALTRGRRLPSNLSGHIHVYKIGTIHRLHTHGRALYSPPAKTRQPRRATHTLSERVAKSATKRHGVPLVTVLEKQPDSHSHFVLAYKQTMLAAAAALDAPLHVAQLFSPSQLPHERATGINDARFRARVHNT